MNSRFGHHVARRHHAFASARPAHVSRDLWDQYDEDYESRAASNDDDDDNDQDDDASGSEDDADDTSSAYGAPSKGRHEGASKSSASHHARVSPSPSATATSRPHKTKTRSSHASGNSGSASGSGLGSRSSRGSGRSSSQGSSSTAVSSAQPSHGAASSSHRHRHSSKSDSASGSESRSSVLSMSSGSSQTHVGSSASSALSSSAPSSSMHLSSSRAQSSSVALSSLPPSTSVVRSSSTGSFASSVLHASSSSTSAVVAQTTANRDTTAPTSAVSPARSGSSVDMHISSGSLASFSAPSLTQSTLTDMAQASNLASSGNGTSFAATSDSGLGGGEIVGVVVGGTVGGLLLLLVSVIMIRKCLFKPQEKPLQFNEATDRPQLPDGFDENDLLDPQPRQPGDMVGPTAGFAVTGLHQAYAMPRPPVEAYGATSTAAADPYAHLDRSTRGLQEGYGPDDTTQFGTAYDGSEVPSGIAPGMGSDFTNSASSNGSTRMAEPLRPDDYGYNRPTYGRFEGSEMSPVMEEQRSSQSSMTHDLGSVGKAFDSASLHSPLASPESSPRIGGYEYSNGGGTPLGFREPSGQYVFPLPPSSSRGNTQGGTQMTEMMRDEYHDDHERDADLRAYDAHLSASSYSASDAGGWGPRQPAAFHSGTAGTGTGTQGGYWYPSSDTGPAPASGTGAGAGTSAGARGTSGARWTDISSVYSGIFNGYAH